MQRAAMIVWLLGGATWAWAGETSSVELAFLQGNSAVVAQQCPADSLPARLLPQEEQACLLSVRALIQQRSFAAARERITALQTVSGSAEWRAALQLALADAYYVEGNWRAAQQAYQTAAEQARPTHWRMLATYGLARTTQYLSDLPTARSLFADVVRFAPWSFEAESARDILNDDAYLAVQVGAFHDRANAVRLLKELQGRGYQPYLQEAITKGAVHFRVRIGRFTSYAEAERMRDELDRLGYVTRIYP